LSVDLPARRARLWLAAVVGAGTLLIGSQLGRQSLWMDEGYTVIPVVEATGVPDLLARVGVEDTQPPASHLLLYALRPLLPAKEWGWRLPALLAFELGVLLLFATVRRLWGGMTALLAVVLTQFSPFLAFYAMEARNYGLWFLSITLALWALSGWCRAVAAGDRRAIPYAIVWGAANGLGLLTHLFHLFALVTQLVLVAGLLRRTSLPRLLLWRGVATFVLAQTLTAAPFLEWFLQSEASALRSGVGWRREPVLASLLYYPFAMTFGFSLGPDLRELHTSGLREILRGHSLSLGAAALALIGAAIAIVALWRDARRGTTRRWESLALLTAPAVGLIGPTLFVLRTSFPLLPRHLLFVWPALAITLAVTVVRRPGMRPAIAGLFLLQLLAFGNLLWNDIYAKDDERGAVRFADEHSGGRGYVIGDVAPLYVTRNRGLVRKFAALSSPETFDPALTDLWLASGRPWEDHDGSYRRKVERTASRLGLVEADSTDRFRGIVLRHWVRAGGVP
jgi:uncharacterized membrane protein